MNLIFAVLCSAALQNSDPFESRQPEHREYLLKQGGGSKETEAAVRKAIDWLVKNQKPDGSWEAPEADCRVGVTGLAVLAFLGAGHSPESKEHGASIRKAFQFLRSVQDAEGCVGARGEKYLYGHAIATAAFAEALAMSGVKDYEPPGQRCVDFLVAAQNPGSGWRYWAKSGESDTSVTAWAVQALWCAEHPSLNFPKAAYDGAMTWLNQVTDESGRAAYLPASGGPEEKFDLHPTPTAMSMISRRLITGVRAEPRLAGGTLILAKDLPRWDTRAIDFCYWYFGSFALFKIDGPSGATWKAWNEALKTALLKNQLSEGKDAGSWNPVDRWSRFVDSRVYATAINALSLETYYRYVKFFRGQEK